MSRPYRTAWSHTRHGVTALAGSAALLLGVSTWAAETTEPVAMSITAITLKLDTAQPLAIRARAEKQPPAIVIEFPERQVIGSLPEQTTISTGVVQTITAQYARVSRPQGKRFVRSLRIGLSGPYTSRVRSEPGRILVEIDHPASVRSASLEVGLRGGTVIGGFTSSQLSERFRAMQDALSRAAPATWTLKTDASFEWAGDGTGRQGSSTRRSAEAPASAPRAEAAGGASSPAPASRQSAAAPARRGPAIPALAWAWLIFAMSVSLTAAAGLWWLSRVEPSAGTRRSASTTAGARLPSGMVLISQLVWWAFERQGYHLLAERDLPPPLEGTFRVMMNESAKAGLLFIGNGPFFERQTVEQFARVLRDADVTQGFLVASGSFTIPAQRCAKERTVTLIGREQLIELLSTGASGEYLAKQLEQQQARVEEAKETLRQYAGELDTLRRQRNEASWYLGEERAKSAALESQLTEVTQQLRHHEAELARWEQETAKLRKTWEETQWYLGESQARARHLETQLSALQETVKRVESAEHERDEANWFLGEERTRGQALEQQLTQLQRAAEESAEREGTLQTTLRQLAAELSALRRYGERRASPRVSVPDAVVELYENGADSPMLTGSVRDLSRSGVGLASDRELPGKSPLRLRLCTPNQAPIESPAQLVWQDGAGTPTAYQSGFQFEAPSEETRTRLTQLIEQPNRSQRSPIA